MSGWAGEVAELPARGCQMVRCSGPHPMPIFPMLSIGCVLPKGIRRRCETLVSPRFLWILTSPGGLELRLRGEASRTGPGLRFLGPIGPSRSAELRGRGRACALPAPPGSRLRPGAGGKRPCGCRVQRGSRTGTRSRRRCCWTRRRFRRAGLRSGGLNRLFLLPRLFLLLGGLLFACRLLLTSFFQRLLFLS